MAEFEQTIGRVQRLWWRSLGASKGVRAETPGALAAWPRWRVGAGVGALAVAAALTALGPAGCFTGESALSLPCETKDDCGRGQSCVEGICAVTGSSFCGDAVVDSGEECDQGAMNSFAAACTPECRLNVCGDGHVGPDENCDDGPDNGPGNACNAECALCGDGIRGPGEACDDGPDNGPNAPCTPECAVNVCGDGYVGPGEACDDGAANGTTECTPGCTVNFCGDGYVGSGESCDSDDRTQCTADCDAVFFFDDMELPKAGWEHEIVVSHPDYERCAGPDMHCFESRWLRTPDTGSLLGHPDEGGSTFAWYSGNLSNLQGSSSSRLISPPIDLSQATGPLTLIFYHRYKFKKEPGLDDFFADGALVEVSIDGGPWESLSLPGYVDTVNDVGGNCKISDPFLTNPLLGREAYVGQSQGWLLEVGALDAYAGKTIRLGFQIGSNCASINVPRPDEDLEVEWYLDNLVISGSTVAAPGG